MSKSTKLPKRIAGVKIPKPLRHAAAAMLEQAATPEGRRLIAAALTATAAALTRGLPPRGSERAGADRAGVDRAGADKASMGRAPADGAKPPIDMGGLLGFAATSLLGGLKAAGERSSEPPRKPGEA